MTRDRQMMGAQAAHFTTAEGSHREVQPERLQMLGKRASALFVEQGIPLTDAVARVLSEEHGLNRNHVQRVTEFANNYAFEDMFSKEGADHRVIDFGEHGPADTAAVLQELNSMGREQIKVASRQPAPSRRFVPGQDSAQETHALTKTASARSPQYPYADPYQDLGELRENVGRAKEEMLTKVGEAGLEYDAACNLLYALTKQAVLGGLSPADVTIALLQRAPDRVMVKLALKEIAQRMDHDNIPAVLTKNASARVVNPEHPLMKAFDSFMKTAVDYFGKIKAAEDLSTQYRRVDQKLRGMIQ